MPIDDTKLFDATVAAGQSAMKVALFINGGAATALLALTGAIFKEDRDIAVAIAAQLQYFGIGVTSAALATGITYLTLEFQARGHLKRSNAANWIAILLTTVSYITFCAALFNVAQAFSK